MQTDVVTGAFGYSGAAIARELLAAGHQVRTLTGHPRGGSGSEIDTRPLDFGDPEGLTKDLAGAHTLYCTYWVRFPHGSATRESAVANSKVVIINRASRKFMAYLTGEAKDQLQPTMGQTDAPPAAPASAVTESASAPSSINPASTQTTSAWKPTSAAARLLAR